MTIRTSWKGTLQFGLVNVPIGFVKAFDESGVKFSQVTADGESVGYQNYNKITGEIITDKSEIKRGFWVTEDKVVFIDDADIDAITPEKSKVLEVQKFVDAESIDFRYIGEPAYVISDKGGEQALTVFERSLIETNKAAIASHVVRGKAKTVVLHVEHDSAGNPILVASTLRFGNDVRSVPKVAPVEVSDDYMKIAKKLVKMMSGVFDPNDYQDTFKVEIEKLIEAKAAGEDIEIEKKPVDSGIDNLLAALEKSLT